jgi:hypothetical protein
MQPSVDEPPFEGVGASVATSSQPPPVLTLVPPPGPQTAQAEVAIANSSKPAFMNGLQPSERGGAGVPVFKPVVQDATIESIKAGLEKRSRMFLVIALEGARKAVVEGDELYVEFAPEAKHLRDNLAKPESVKLLREVGREALGREIGVRIVTQEKSDPDASPTKEEGARLEKQSLREIAEQDTDVQKALRTFRAEIVDVRRLEEGELEAGNNKPKEKQSPPRRTQLNPDFS